MLNWKTEAAKRAAELVNDGTHPEDAVRTLVTEYRQEIEWDAEEALLKLVTKKQKDAWAEPPADMDQLRFDLDGYEISINDAPVRYVDADGVERFKPARYSTGNERLDSTAARIQHHVSWVKRSEAEHNRELKQNELLISLGQGPDTTWDQMRHRDTRCWRCGQGWRAGDPFEHGHCDRPESQGGVQVAWEHKSCNRSAKDNPVARLDEEES
jgi:hypothetical protein